MYVISGATGNTGRAAATKLLRAGKQVRALVRDPNKARDLAELGAELVQVELGSTRALERALTGATGVYLLSPPDMATSDFLSERAALLSSVASAIEAAAVPHVVFLSSVGAQHASGTGIIQSVHQGEQALSASGVPCTFVRAAYFVQNWGAVLPVAKQDGVLPSFLPADFTFPQVSSVDVGNVAADALLDGPRGKRILELAGPRDASAREVAASVSKLLGRPVQVVEAPVSAVVPTFMSFGISSNIASLYQAMYEGVINGRVSWQGNGAELRRGTIGIEDALRPLLG
jgi:uncharacterized protein YbjT (DUF2867 family)